MLEVWEDINEHENRYEVSNYGTVRNKTTQKELSKQLNRSGFYEVTLIAEDRLRNVRSLHVLVAEHYVRWTGKKRIKFKDGNKLNCRADNLEW